MRDLQEVMADPVLAERGMVTRAEVGAGITTDLLALPWRIEGARPPLFLPPPQLGEHTADFRERFPA